MDFKIVNEDISELLLRGLLEEIAADGVIEPFEKAAFDKLARVLDISKDRFEQIKSEVKAEVSENPGGEALELDRFLVNSQQKLNDLLDPLEAEDVIRGIGFVLGADDDLLNSIFKPRLDRDLASRFTSQPVHFISKKESICEDQLFCISHFLNKEGREVLGDILNMRESGKHFEAIEKLHLTKVIHEPIRLFLVSRMYQEMGRKRQANYFLEQAKDEGLVSEIYKEARLIMDLSESDPDSAIESWCEFRGKKTSELTIKQATRMIETLIEQYLQRNLIIEATKLISHVSEGSEEFASIRKRYQPLYDRMRHDQRAFSPGNFPYLVQLVLIACILFPGVLTIPLILEFLATIYGQVDPFPPTDVIGHQLAQTLFFALTWCYFLPIMKSQLRLLLEGIGTFESGFIIALPRYLILQEERRYHFCLKDRRYQFYLMVDGMYQAYPYLARFLPFFLHRARVIGDDGTTGRVITTALPGLITGDPLLKTIQKESSREIEETNLFHYSMFLLEALRAHLFSFRYKLIGIVLISSLIPWLVTAVVHGNPTNLNITLGTILFLTLWLMVLYFPLPRRPLLENVPIVLFQPLHMWLIQLGLLQFLLRHYYPYGVSGLVPVLAWMAILGFCFSYACHSREDQYAMTQTERRKQITSTGDEVKEVNLPFRNNFLFRVQMFNGPGSILLTKKFLWFTYLRQRLNRSKSPIYILEGEKAVLEIENYSLPLLSSSAETTKSLIKQKVPHFLRKQSGIKKISTMKQVMPFFACVALLICWELFTNIRANTFDKEFGQPDISSLEKALNQDAFLVSQNQQLIHIPESISYDMVLKLEEDLIYYIRSAPITYQEWENNIRFAPHDSKLSDSKHPPFLKPYRIRNNLWDLGLWHFVYKDRNANWSLYGEYLGDYCHSMDLDVVQVDGRLNCGLAFNLSDVVTFIKQVGFVPDFITLELLEATLKGYGELLFDLEPEFRQTEELALASIEQFTSPWNAIDPRLKESRSFIKKALKRNGRLLQFLNADMRGDRDLVLTALRQDPYSYKAMQQELYKDLGIVLEVLKVQGLALQYLPEKFKRMPQVQKLAVEQNGLAIQYVPVEFRKNEDLLDLASFEERGITFQFIPGESGDGWPERLESGYFLSQTEITNEQYYNLMESVPSSDPTSELPVHGITEDMAYSFVTRLNLAAGITLYSIPPIKAWEKGAHGGSKDRFFFGNDSKELARYAWFIYNSEDRLHPVGELELNPFGLADIYGNVLEWVLPTTAREYRSRGIRVTGFNSRKLPGVCGGSYTMNYVYCQPLEALQRVDERKYEFGLRLLRYLDNQ